MNQPGPMLEALLHHLADCPVEFTESCQTSTGSAQVAAIISDFFRPVSVVDTSPFVTSLVEHPAKHLLSKRHYATMAVVVWLFHHEWFEKNSAYLQAGFQWLQHESLKKMSEIVSPEQFIADPDRREELVRASLHAVGLRPSGETHEQSEDRRIALDSIERKKILEATVAAEKRARQIREEMAQKRALESASRYGE